MKKKEYPLNLENWGADTYQIVSRGHHDFETFEKLVRQEYSAWGNFFGCAHHDYMKAIPREGYKAYYVSCSPDTKGAFPVTVAIEGWEEKFGRQAWARKKFNKGEVVAPVNAESGTTPLEICQSHHVNLGEQFWTSYFDNTGGRNKREANDYRIATEAERKAGCVLAA